MFKRSLVILLVFGLIFVIGCSKDNTNEPTEVNEFELLTELGDQYFSTYVTPAGNPVNVKISDVFPILADDDATNDPFIIDYR